MQFLRYQHVERFGSNDSGEVASRNRPLTAATDDNHGVRAHVLNDSRFRDYLAEFPNHRLFGEWLVPHTIRAYQDSAWRQLYIFDVMVDDRYLPYLDYAGVCAAFGLRVVPPIGKGTNLTAEDVAACLDQCAFLMMDACLGEGIVIKRYDFVNRFGRTCWAKLVRHAVKAAANFQKPLPAKSVEADIVANFLPPELVEKEFAKIVSDSGAWNSSLIPKLLGVTWHTFISEEIFNAVRHFKNPTIDFKILNALAVQKIKDVKPELFA